MLWGLTINNNGHNELSQVDNPLVRSGIEKN